jgi:anti-sigma factor RsiW
MSEMTCEQLVELVTDYLEDALTPQARRRFERHTALCPGCEVYLDQIRVTIAEVGRLTPERLAPAARDQLVEAFRGWAADERR